MAGTVSAGTFTGGTLTEINDWLADWQKARTNGVSLKTKCKTPSYSVGQEIKFLPNEIPNHFVKIKSLTGASGGGVSAALLLSGLTTNKTAELLKDIWTAFDLKDMLDNSDIQGHDPIYSVLNVKPIEELMGKIADEKWNTTDYAKALDYLDDNIEVFFTLASYQGIPYKVTPSEGNQVSYGIHKTHLDYIKFNFSKNGTPAPDKPNLPFPYNLTFNSNQTFKNDSAWKQLIDSCPATAAFPVGFRPRSLTRKLKEYTGKLFYLNYTEPFSKIDYSTLQPAWDATDEEFNMVYLDGGTFNREPHDIARASIIESLKIKEKQIPNDGIKTNACVILIDPFPSNFDSLETPGSVKKVPDLFHQPQYILGAMTDQGRFRPDWIEKAVDDNYYSRYLISPIRRNADGNIEEQPLAGGLLGAFSGFIDKSYRLHDYNLGHYNTNRFLSTNFTVPIGNEVVDYYQKANDVLKEKYEAVGWYIPPTNNDKSGHCQIIPRMTEPSASSSTQPEWPSITGDQWDILYDLAIERAKQLIDSIIDIGWLVNKPADFITWYLLKGKVESALEMVKNELLKNKLLKEADNG